MVSAAFMNMVIGANKQISTEYNDKRKVDLQTDSDMLKQANEARLLKEKVQQEYELRHKEMMDHDANTYDLYYGKAVWKREENADKNQPFVMPGFETPPENSPLRTDPLYTRIQSSVQTIQEGSSANSEDYRDAHSYLTTVTATAEKERYGALEEARTIMTKDADPKMVANKLTSIVSNMTSASDAQKKDTIEQINSVLSNTDPSNATSLYKSRGEVFNILGTFANQASVQAASVKALPYDPPAPTTSSVESTRVPIPFRPGTNEPVMSKEEWDSFAPNQKAELYIHANSTDNKLYPDEFDTFNSKVKEFRTFNAVPGLGVNKAEAENVQAEMDKTAFDKDLITRFGRDTNKKDADYPNIDYRTGLATPSQMQFTLVSKTTGTFSPSKTSSMLDDAEAYYRTNPHTSKVLGRQTTTTPQFEDPLASLFKNLNILRFAHYKDEEKIGSNITITDEEKKKAYDEIRSADAKLDSLFGRTTKTIEAFRAVKDPVLQKQIHTVLKQYDNPDKLMGNEIESRDLPPIKPVNIRPFYVDSKGNMFNVDEKTALKLKELNNPSKVNLPNGEQVNVTYP